MKPAESGNTVKVHYTGTLDDGTVFDSSREHAPLEITIGNGTSVQDNVIIHAPPNESTTIGNNVTLGHGCIIHNAVVKDDAVIGMGAIVSDYAVVGEWAIVGEGAVVRSKFEVPKETIAVGVPAKVIGEIQEHHREELTEFKRIYRSLAIRYPQGLKKIE